MVPSLECGKAGENFPGFLYGPFDHSLGNILLKAIRPKPIFDMPRYKV
jgi:hypothetical protein